MALNVSSYLGTTKKKRPGVHAKSKTSKLKKSRNYKKLYKGQGRWVKIHTKQITPNLWSGEEWWFKKVVLKLIRKRNTQLNKWIKKLN